LTRGSKSDKEDTLRREMDHLWKKEGKGIPIIASAKIGGSWSDFPVSNLWNTPFTFEYNILSRWNRKVGSSSKRERCGRV
jgi:hypothetical protein